MSSPIQRVAARLRNISQLSTQIARVGIEDEKTAKLWPENMQVIADSLVDAGETLNRYATEISAYRGRRLEDNDALVTLAQTAANISTVLGKEGDNLEILTHSDPDYVLGVLLRATDEARQEAISKMSAEDRAKWIRRLGGAALLQIEEKRQEVFARWVKFVEDLPEDVLTDEEKRELTTLDG